MPFPKSWVGSPNFTSGRGAYRPEAIVIHIMQGTLGDTDSWFGKTISQVSAHYGVGQDGTVHQYVHEGDTAWHAGRVVSPTWSLIKPGVNPNLYTIGIEHEGFTGNPWPAAMLATSASIVADVARRWSIALDRDHIIGHAEIYAPKGFCPGTGVDLMDLIARAKQNVLAGAVNKVVEQQGQTTAVVRLNLRAGAPSTLAPIARVLDAGSQLNFDAWTSTGEAIHGKAHWYEGPDGKFAWAGGTSDPTPALVVT